MCNDNHCIISDSNILDGKPYIDGTRFTVSNILDMFANGMHYEDIEKTFPPLNKEVVKKALLYAVEHFSNKPEQGSVKNEQCKKSPRRCPVGEQLRKQTPLY